MNKNLVILKGKKFQSINQKKKSWGNQDFFTDPFGGKGFKNFAFETAENVVLSNPIEDWMKILTGLFNHFPDQFSDFVKLQSKKKRDRESIKPRLEDCKQHLLANRDNSVALDLSKLDFICLDVDDPLIGKQLIKHFENSLTQSVKFEEVFGKPLVVKTVTPGHLHFYYRWDPNLKKILKGKKKSVPSRLGFAFEYIQSVVTFASQERHPQNVINLFDCDILKPELYPYNYPAKREFVSLLKGCPATGSTRELSLISGGQRNNDLFSFCAAENFNKAHALTINALCCQEPLPDSEVIQCFVSTAERLGNFNGQSSNFTNFDLDFSVDLDLVNLRRGESVPQISLKSLYKTGLIKKDDVTFFAQKKFNPDRILMARLGRTPMPVIELVAAIEFSQDYFFQSEAWVGQCLEAVLINYLLSQNLRKTCFIDSEKTWYLWNEKIWVNSHPDTLFEAVWKIINKKIRFGAAEAKVNKTNLLNALKANCFFPEWPTPALAIAFKDGYLTFDEQNILKVIEPDPNFYIRSLIPVSANLSCGLTATHLRFLMDLSAEEIYGLNIVRLLFYCILQPGSGNFGFLLNGDAGGAKSTITKIVKLLHPLTSSNIDPKSISDNSFHILTLVRGKAVIVIPDVDPKSISKGTVEFIKKQTGRDDLVGERKFGDILNFRSNATLLIITNANLSSFKAFNDNAIYQRLINLEIPALKDIFRVREVEQLIIQNAEAFLNWALNIPRELVERVQRVNLLNDLINVQKPMFEKVCLELFVYQQDNFLSTETLVKAYNKEVYGETVNKSQEISNDAFGKAFTIMSRRFIETQNIKTNAKKNGKRGFLNVGLRKENEDQQNFVYNEDPELKRLLSILL